MVIPESTPPLLQPKPNIEPNVFFLSLTLDLTLACSQGIFTTFLSLTRLIGSLPCRESRLERVGSNGSKGVNRGQKGSGGQGWLRICVAVLTLVTTLVLTLVLTLVVALALALALTLTLTY